MRAPPPPPPKKVRAGTVRATRESPQALCRGPPHRSGPASRAQVFWRDVVKFKARKIQIASYSFDGRPAPWCEQTHGADPPPGDQAQDWLMASETLLFSYLTNNWARLAAGGSDLFVDRVCPGGEGGHEGSC